MFEHSGRSLESIIKCSLPTALAALRFIQLKFPTGRSLLPTGGRSLGSERGYRRPNRHLLPTVLSFLPVNSTMLHRCRRSTRACICLRQHGPPRQWKWGLSDPNKLLVGVHWGGPAHGSSTKGLLARKRQGGVFEGRGRARAEGRSHI